MAAAQSGSGFALIGIAAGQSARVNALNAARLDPAGTRTCGVILQFQDSQGQVLTQSTVSLAPGKSASLDLSYDSLKATDLRVQIRAVLIYGYSGGANPPPGVLNRTACDNLVPSLEVYDNASGRTSLILTDAKVLPPPITPAQ
jgi:hypothetical protein